MAATATTFYGILEATDDYGRIRISLSNNSIVNIVLPKRHKEYWLQFAAENRSRKISADVKIRHVFGKQHFDLVFATIIS